MIIYIVATILSIAFFYISTKVEKKTTKYVLLVFTMLPYILVAGFRYGVGTDFFYRYVSDFNNIANGISVTNLEIGFKLLIYLCILFTKNSQLLFIIVSILITALVIGCITKNSKNIFISIIIFGLGGFFFQSLNLVRQFLAMSIIFFAYRYLLKEDKKLSYILAVLLASSLHITSLIMLLLLFFKKKIVFNPIVTFATSIIILLFGHTILQFIKPIIAVTRFNVYLQGTFAVADHSLLYTLVNLCIYAFMIVMYVVRKKKLAKENIKNEDIESILFINIQALSLLFMTMSSMHILFARIAYYFSIFQIISIPYFVENSEITIKYISKKMLKRLMYAGIIICFLSLTFYTNILHNDNGVLPYKTIFYKDIEIK